MKEGWMKEWMKDGKRMDEGWKEDGKRIDRYLVGGGHRTRFLARRSVPFSAVFHGAWKAVWLV